MSRWLWIPAVLVLNVWGGYVSQRLNQGGGKAWLWAGWVINLIPLWLWVARSSHALVFDGLLFDALLTVSYTVSVLFFTGAVLGALHVAGLMLVLFGLLLFKLGGAP